MTTATPSSPERPALWHVPAPTHFDSAWPWWAKLVAGLLLTGLAFCIDTPVAAWALRDPFPKLLKGDLAREIGMVEQYGQWTCSVLVILAVVLLDRNGRRKALAIAIGCFATVLACYLLKDLFGRTRPDVLADGTWKWLGPAKGFTGGSKYQSFPSAHTTGAMALSAGLAWFYPRGRALFYFLAYTTAFLRVLHHAHFPSDVLAGTVLAVTITRATLGANLAGRLLMGWPRKDTPMSSRNFSRV